MNKRYSNGFAAIMTTGLIALGGLTSTNSLALETDKEQELIFSADGGSHMSIVNDVRLLEMSDNVKITQGSLEIRGDTATIESSISNNEVSKITVLGNPVYYQQQLDSSDAPVKGTSNSITFSIIIRGKNYI